MNGLTSSDFLPENLVVVNANKNSRQILAMAVFHHSTVTLLARFLGISTSFPNRIAISIANNCTTTNISKNSSIECSYGLIWMMSSASSKYSVVIATMVESLADNSSTLLLILSYKQLLAISAMVNNSASTNAMGPCFISPAG